ncbi:MAG: hypothetical protein ACXWEY_03360 [Bacteroidia bacterium]
MLINNKNVKSLSCFTLLILSLFINIGCKKDYTISRPAGERAKYTGKYAGTYEWYRSGHPDVCNIGNGKSKDTLTVKLGKTDSTLSIISTELCPDGRGGYKNCTWNTEWRFTLRNDSLYGYRGKNGTVCQESYQYITNKLK